jgi:filamentous hemagglutinin family protein
LKNNLIYLAGVLGVPLQLWGNPTGMTVQNGAASAVSSGPILTVTAANNAHLNWQGFNIAAGETTVFQQPSSSSIVWNSIGGLSASQIYGSLQANGIVVLMNPSGFYFGPNSYVKAAGLVVSTAAGSPVESAAGAGWQFTGPPPAASIINYGQLSAEPGGFVYLLGANIDNRGGISASGGSIGLCAGQTVLLSDRPDGRGLSAQVTLPAGSVNNSGQLIADAGSILASAQVVNQNGLVQADSVGAVNGVVELYASDSLTLGASSVVRVNGDPSGISSGGNILLKSDNSFADTQGSVISATGGTVGGNGGTVELSAPEMSAVRSEIDGHANSGAGGILTLDPTDIVIGNGGTGSAGSGTVNSGSSPGTLNLNVNSAFTGFSEIDLQATHNISLSAYTAWDLAASTGIAVPGCLLKLEAGNNITLGNGSSLMAEDGWSVSLAAGRNFSSADAVTLGAGNILFSGTAGLQTGDGDIALLAGNSVTVNNGYVRTVNGGNISVAAMSGSVNAGNNPNGYDFRPVGTGYVVDPDLGGISTANGGNVNILAGTDIASYLPVAGGVQTDAGTGCFGPTPGNVILTAGHDITGHYVVANGSGTIEAGHNAGTLTSMLALSLISGGWNVSAGHDILLQEVRNPNGIFNDFGSASSPLLHYFDYSPDAYTILTAGDGVELLGTALPRYPDSFDSSIPSIYPPTLEITAGAGGVTLANDVILFPSTQGWLGITTTDGGGLISSKSSSDFAQLILSDSGNDQYLQSGDFGLNDHAAVPVHLDDNRAVELNISGNMDGIYLVSAEMADVNVGGNLINCRFDGQNLHAGDVTSVNVTGAIENRSEFTSVTLSTAPDFSALIDAYPALTGDLVNLVNQFYYNPATMTLTFQGRMTTEQLQALLNLTVQEYAANGQPVLDSNGNPVTIPAQFITTAALNSLYAASQDIRSDPNSGFRIGGSGSFDVTAASLDLGATAGIVSEGPAENPALANYFTRGADINVSLAGDLDMFSTTISCINGGSISVVAGGDVNLGSTYFNGDDAFARGIFSTADSDVFVVAGGDININGSRIAAFDGGNVTVESLHGDVAVGSGGLGDVSVEEISVDPATRAITSFTPTIPGSGILATTFPRSPDSTFPPSQNPVGNILVETPEGDITTTAAGILQIPLNGNVSAAGTVTLTAGTEDASGDVLFLGNTDVSGSGVIGNSVQLKATGDITGSIVARDNLYITAGNTVSVSAFSLGQISINADKIDTSELISFGDLNIVGNVTDSQLLSQNVNTSGGVTGSQEGFSAGTSANATSQGLSEDLATKTLGLANAGTNDEVGAESGPGGSPQIKRFTGRVTVLPAK